jgi:RNA 3'-terminal phosphate cyclase (ATP)
MGDMLVIDGSHGEGGGQILRSALSLAAIMGRPVRVEHIRAGRPRPGLAAQHVTAARAVAAVCGGVLEGDELESQTLTLTPDGALHAGDYLFDVAAAREGGSAGAVTLVLQTVLLPLALADGTSTIELHGGTHMAWSPSFHYARDTWLPVLARMGVTADIELIRWGWYPVGGGAIRARIEGPRADRGTRRALSGPAYPCRPRLAPGRSRAGDCRQPAGPYCPTHDRPRPGVTGRGRYVGRDPPAPCPRALCRRRYFPHRNL